MRLILGLGLLAACPAMATDVVDTFETDANQNGWSFTDDIGDTLGTIQPSGGNPGGWLDSGIPFYNDHPAVASLGPPGSKLRAALASGTLLSASVDFQRIDAAADCGPVYDLPSHFSIKLIDRHTVPSTPPTVIQAYTTAGESPLEGPFPWMTASFTIPSAATDVPAGWVLKAPPDINYTWQDMMHNIDGIALGLVDPDDITYSACWHIGVDNIKITYAGEQVFGNGFDAQ